AKEASTMPFSAVVIHPYSTSKTTPKLYEFYQDAVKKLAHELFHEHKQVGEQQMKDRIKEKLDADELCVSMLQKSEEKGYYVRRVKDSLWSTFDLYKSSNPEDKKADTYIALIIKSVFTAKKKRTASNSIWVQSVIETIFDKKYLSIKIDSKDDGFLTYSPLSTPNYNTPVDNPVDDD
ncbi:3937_t:CDS:2, partial [Funneliformis caledonium]